MQLLTNTRLMLHAFAYSVQEFCSAMAGQGVTRMASGGNPPKFYFHAQPAASDNRILVEALSIAAGLSVTVKAEDSVLAQPFQQQFSTLAAGFS